jgi:hypothetical protein
MTAIRTTLAYPGGARIVGIQLAATRQSSVDGLALKLVHRRRRNEACAIDQAVHIDNGASASCHLCDCGDEDAAASANQEITGSGSKLIAFNE